MNHHPRTIWLDRKRGGTWARTADGCEPVLACGHLKPQPYRQHRLRDGQEPPKGSVWLAPDCGSGDCGIEREWCSEAVWEPCQELTANGNPCRAKAICYRPVWHWHREYR